MANFTPAEYARAWAKRTGKVKPEIAELVHRTGLQMLAVSLHNLQRLIYSIPEDTTAAGKKKWVRTWRLFHAEKVVHAPDWSAVALANSMVYARARHELGRDGRKTKRLAHWRDGIFAEIRESVRQDTERTIGRVLEER